MDKIFIAIIINFNEWMQIKNKKKQFLKLIKILIKKK